MITNEQIKHLLTGCRNNNRSSQKELYLLLEDYAFRICYVFTKNSQSSKEIKNEAFLKLFKNIDKFEVTRLDDVLTALKGWFKKIIINTAIDYCKKDDSYSQQHTSLKDDSYNLPQSGETGIDKLSYKELIETIRLLPPAYNCVFNLFVLHGFTHEEISQQLNISVGTSKSNLSRARNILINLITKKQQYNYV